MQDAGELEERAATLEWLFHALKADVKRLAGSKEEKPPLTANGVMGMSGIQLPNIEVPIFEGNLFKWQIFWQ